MVRIHLPVQELQEMRVQPLVGEYPLEEEIATHSSTLAWEIPWAEEPGGLQSMGSQRIRHDWATKQQPPVCYLATLAGITSRRPPKARWRFSAWLCNLSQGFRGWILGGTPKAADSWELHDVRLAHKKGSQRRQGFALHSAESWVWTVSGIQDQLIDIS